MKKTLSVLLAIIMIFGMCCFAYAVNAEQKEKSSYPLILVPGYSSSRLYYTDENGEKVMVWNGLDLSIGAYLMEDIVDVGMGFAQLTAGNARLIGETVGKNMLECYEPLVMTQDATNANGMVYDRLYKTPEELKASTLGDLQYEQEIMTYFSEYIVGGLDNVFDFTTDFRMGAIYSADLLHEFVNEVLDYTGAEKVNIFAVSHGGQVSGTYLSRWCQEGQQDAGKINRAVLTVPALGGAGFAYDALNGGVHLEVEKILQFIEYGEMMEEDYDWLVKAQVLGFLDDIIFYILPYAHELVGLWGSMWDFVPLSYYEELKTKWLEEGKITSADCQLLQNSDKMHYEIMPYYEESFASCKNAGTDISIIAGYNCQIVTGLKDDSDAIITTEAATGAVTAPLGKRFADGYTQKEDNGFYQVSPSMTVDASTGYLPKDTWYIENLYHGMTFKDPYVRDLMTKLMFTDEIEDVTDNPDYPQFHAAKSNSLTVYAAFNNSQDGFVDKNDTQLVLTNLSKEYDLKILAVSAPGTSLTFGGLTTKVLKPGESVSICVYGKLPEVSLMNMDLLVDYCLVGSKTPIGERRFNFTVMNGDPVAYDESNPIVDADVTQGIDNVMGENTEADNILTIIGLKPMLAILFNIVTPIMNLVKKIVSFFTKAVR